MEEDGAPSDPDPTEPDPTEPDPTEPDPTEPDPTEPNPNEPDFLGHLASDSARFAEVLKATPSAARVPTCPDWDADDLLWHLTEVQWFWGTIVGRGLTSHADVEALKRDDRPDDRDEMLALFLQASRDLQQNLSTTSPDTAAWTWSQEQNVGFIRRRQAHEALIHRLDAELTSASPGTAGARTPMDARLSTDGVDEVLQFLYGGVPSWGVFTPEPAFTVRVRATDTDHSWLLTLGQFAGTDDAGTAHDVPDLRVTDSDRGTADIQRPAAAKVSGAAADLDCWLWHRPALGTIERTGDPMVLDRLDLTIASGVD
jgi:uncharacterized protein (TIGR03083 family)